MKQIFLGFLIILLGNSAVAGVYIETMERDIKTQKSVDASQKMYVQGGLGRMESGDGHVSIIKGDTMYVLDTKRKTYMVFDKASADAMAKQMNDMMAKMRAQMAQLPPAQRAEMEKMMGGQMPGKPAANSKLTSSDTGRMDTVEGRSCRIWQIKRNGALDDELCVVPYSSLPGKEDIGALFLKIGKLFEGMSKAMPGAANDNEFDAYARVNGYPVRLRGYTNGKSDGTETVLKVWREEAVVPALFVIPAGYRKQAMPALGEG